MTVPAYDLRDPKLSITPDGRLMVLMGGSFYVDGKCMSRLPHISFSENGRDFSDPVPVRIAPSIRAKMDLIWRLTWAGDTGYGVIYELREGEGQDWLVHLVKTTNGVDYEKCRRIERCRKAERSDGSNRSRRQDEYSCSA